MCSLHTVPALHETKLRKRQQGMHTLKSAGACHVDSPEFPSDFIKDSIPVEEKKHEPLGRQNQHGEHNFTRRTHRGDRGTKKCQDSILDPAAEQLKRDVSRDRVHADSACDIVRCLIGCAPGGRRRIGLETVAAAVVRGVGSETVVAALVEQRKAIELIVVARIGAERVVSRGLEVKATGDGSSSALCAACPRRFSYTSAPPDGCILPRVPDRATSSRRPAHSGRPRRATPCCAVPWGFIFLVRNTMWGLTL